MAETSFPYAGDSVQEPEWNALGRLFRRSGVVDGADNELAPTAVTGELQVQVASGECYLEGFYYSNDAAETLTLDAADLNDDRIDLVVVRSDRVAGTARLAVITGTPATSPAAPTVTQDHEGSDVYEIALAEVLVQAAASNVDGNVTDVRTFSLTPQGDAVQVVEHGADSTVARTSDAELVLWVGSVEPDNGVESDLYLRTTDGHRLYHDGSNWIDPLDNATDGMVETVNHGATASTARPSGAARVLWVGTVEPENGTTDDLLLRTDEDAWYRYDGAAWVEVGGVTAKPIFMPATEFAAEIGSSTLAEVGSTAWLAWMLDASASETVSGHTFIPADWSTVHIDLYWTNAGSGSGDVRFENMTFEQAGDGSTLALGSSGGTQTATAPAQNVVEVTRLMADMAVTGSQMLRARVARAGGSGSDTLGNDIGVLGVLITKAS